MTIKEIADVLQLDERTIQLKAKALFPERIKNGVKTVFNQKEVTLLKLDLEKKFGVETELEQELFIEKALLLQQKKIQGLQNQIDVMTPKALVYDDFIDIKDLHTMSETAKIIGGIGRNKLFVYLKLEKILDKHNIPYQNFVDAGYFQVKVSVNTDINKNIPVTLVTPKGIEYIKNRLNKMKILI